MQKKTIRDKSGKSIAAVTRNPRYRLLELRLNVFFPGSHSAGGRILHSVALGFRSKTVHQNICRAEHPPPPPPLDNLVGIYHTLTPGTLTENSFFGFFFSSFFFCKQKDMKALFKWADLQECSLKQWTLDGNLAALL